MKAATAPSWCRTASGSGARVHHGDDAEHDLEQRASPSVAAKAPRTAPSALAPAAQPGGDAEREQQVADQAVVELHERRVVEEVAPERRLARRPSDGKTSPAISGQSM